MTTSFVAITLAVRRQVTKSPASTRNRHVIARPVASASLRYYMTHQAAPTRQPEGKVGG